MFGDLYYVYVYNKRTIYMYMINFFQNDTSRVNISVENVNDWEPLFRYAQYEFNVTSAREGAIVGEFSLYCIKRHPLYQISIAPYSKKRVTFQEHWKQLTAIEATKSIYLSEAQMRGK